MRKRQNREIGEGENDDMSLLRSGVTLGGPSIPPLFHAMILHGNSIGVRAGSRERPRPDATKSNESTWEFEKGVGIDQARGRGSPPF
jgi:hypothetical protein